MRGFVSLQMWRNALASLDFTSSLYLGIWHPHETLAPWAAVTLGKPAALEPVPGGAALAAGVARLQGLEAGVVGPSTLHLFWDLLAMLAREGDISIHLDRGSYPIAGWGALRAGALGTPVRRFHHHDPTALVRQLRNSGRRRPVVATDGFCPGCGVAAPLSDYLEAVREHRGLLLVDDTQALGVLGARACRGSPYGEGGGGSLQAAGIGGPDVVTVCSCAKAFGAPLAVLCGGRPLVRCCHAESETAVHCSPPSVVAVRAGLRALAINRRCGDAIRARLWWLVTRFRRRLAYDGLTAVGGPFPVQTVRIPNGSPPAVHACLLRAGIRTVLRPSGINGASGIIILLTADKRPSDVERLADGIMSAIGKCAAGGVISRSKSLRTDI
jgi:8-amino-7-oxononanoate synthase